MRDEMHRHRDRLARRLEPHHSTREGLELGDVGQWVHSRLVAGREHRQPIEVHAPDGTDNPLLHAHGQRWQVSVAKEAERFQGQLWIEALAVDHAGCRQRCRQTDASLQQRVQIDVVLGLRSLLHDRRLHSRQVEQRGDPPQIGDSGKRHDQRIATLDTTRQRVRSLLQDGRPVQERNGGVQVRRVKRTGTEEVEVDRLAVTQLKGYCRPTTQHELCWNRSEFGPQQRAALRAGSPASVRTSGAAASGDQGRRYAALKTPLIQFR